MPNLTIYRWDDWKNIYPLPGSGTYRFLTIGDSWFSIGALPSTATTNLLQEMVFGIDACAVDFSQPGAEAEQLWVAEPTSTWVYNPNFTSALKGGTLAYKWDAILLSAGGNDLIAAALTPLVYPNGDPVGPDLRILLTPTEWRAAADVSRYVSEAGWSKFSVHLDAVFGDLVATRDASTSQSQGAPIFFHSYSYVQPRNAGIGLEVDGAWTLGPWLYKAVSACQIPPNDWLALSEHLMDRLFALLQSIAVKHMNLFVLDLRAILPYAQADSQGVDGYWENEIHPTRDGYRQLAALYAGKVESTVTGAPIVAKPK